MSRHRLGAVLASLALAVSLGSAVSAQEAEPEAVSIGLDSFGGAVLVYVADEQGFFADHGIEATIDTYSFGLDTLNAALAGTADFGWAFDYGSLGAMAPDQLRYVATLTRTQPGFHQLAITVGVGGVEDLAGKRIGIAEGTQQHYITLKHLESLGISPDDVELLNFGTVLEMIAGMRTGQLDAAWVFGQGVAEAQQIEGAQIVASDSVVLPGGLGLLIATRTLVEERPEVVERVLAALLDAEAWVDANDPDLAQSAEIIAGRINAPVEGVLANISSADQTVSFTQSDLELLKEFADFRSQLSPDTPLDVESYLALDPLRAVAPDVVTVEPS